jgi:hypothetical protein
VVGLVLLLLGFGDWSGVESPGGAARVWFGWGARRREDGLSSGSAELLLLAALSRKGRGRRLSSWISLLASAFGGRDGKRERERGRRRAHEGRQRG